MLCSGVCKAIREVDAKFALRQIEATPPAARLRLNCGEPLHRHTSVLQAALATGNPEKIQMAARLLPPEGFLARTQAGLLPLEEVLAARPPLAVLHEVLAAASSCLEALTARMSDGKAPFHRLVGVFNAKAVAEFARHFSEQAIMVPSSNGVLALHDLCKLQDSLPAVLRLLEMLSPESFSVVDAHGNTPLHLAIAHGAVDVALALARKTSLAAASATNCTGSSVLHLAVAAGLADLAQVLAATLPPEVLLLQDRTGLTALHLAVVGHMEALVEELLKRVPPVHLEVCDDSGRHALILAIFYRYPERLRQLIACVAPFGPLPPGLRLEVTAAAEANCRMLARLLAAHPTLASLPDAMGRCAVHWAGWRQNCGALEVLLERVPPQELSKADGDGLNVLHWSAFRGVDRTPLSERGVMLPLAELTDLVRGPRVSLRRPPTYTVRFDWEAGFLGSLFIRKAVEALGPGLLLAPDRLGRIPVHYAVLCNDHSAVASLGRMLSETERLIADKDGVTPAAVARAISAVDDITRMFPQGKPHYLPGAEPARGGAVAIPRRDRVALVAAVAQEALQKEPAIQKKKKKKKAKNKAEEVPPRKGLAPPPAHGKSVAFSPHASTGAKGRAVEKVSFSPSSPRVNVAFSPHSSASGSSVNVAFSPHGGKGSAAVSEKVVAFSRYGGKAAAGAGPQKPRFAPVPKELGKCKCGYSGSTAHHLQGIVASLLRAKGGTLKRDSIDGVVGDQHGKQSVYWLRENSYGPRTRTNGKSIVYIG